MMKKMVSLLLVLLLALSLAACGLKAPGNEKLNDLTRIDRDNKKNNADDKTDQPTLPDTGEIWRKPDEIEVYPYSEKELSDAYRCAVEYRAHILEDPSTVIVPSSEDADSDAEGNLAFDPILVDIGARQQMSDNPYPGWSKEDYYARCIRFCLDGKSFYEFRRDSVDSPWEYYNGGVPVGDYSACAMTQEELAQYSVSGGRILAGYAVSDTERWFYAVDDTTGQVRFVMEQTEPTSPADELSDADAEELQTLSTQFFNVTDDICIPNMFLATGFDDVKDVDLYVVFYDGVSREVNQQITDAEKEALRAAYQAGGEGDWSESVDTLDVSKVPASRMNELLKQYTGLALNETNKNHLDGFVYLEEFDAYYHVCGDTYCDRYTFTGMERTDDGLIVLQYESATHSAPDVSGTVTLRETENGYQFVSNARG